ncbi:amidase [Marivita sp. GX14005]|uniref:amidase n=1 Tax=Marivita sp. GX14005 TaxID=2942276 RepID=UPI00201974B1|nr:amidase [Marivita sp. GX14005]MCL3883108.1 amidase [Marivita sp. GX14005]
MTDTAICDWPAVTLAEHLRSGALSSEQLVTASLARIEALDGTLRAFITVDADAALDAARAADAHRRSGGELLALHGMPVAIKDVTATKGLRTTQGSRIHADTVPEEDAGSVARLRDAGAIILGKTNTPEFAFGAICTNALCGPTANPWDTARSSGGSSGGSAVAVATGMVPLAQGTDFGGSVRTPASFCGAVGLRPQPGTIAEPERKLGEARLATQGVLARSTADALMMLRAMAGPHPLDPASRGVPLPPKPDSQATPRIAASVDLDGAFPVDPWVRDRFEAACSDVAAALGPVERAAPDLKDGVQAFKTLRAAESWFKFGAMVDRHEDQLTPSYVWNVRQGREISAERYLAAEATRTAMQRAALRFFETHDLLLMPAASVPPFRNDGGEVMQVGDAECETIIDYLACTFLISLIGFPCLSLPAPTGEGDLPFGLQIVARPGREALLWGAAMRLEKAGFAHRFAPIVRDVT